MYDLGNNLLAGECCQGSNSIVAPAGGLGLAPLADNGGLTKTHLPQSGSPALNAIPAGVDDCGSDAATDQRGVARSQGSRCDIGAAEVAVFVDSTPTPVATPTSTNTPTSTAVPPTATNTAVPPIATPSGTLIGTCGPITVYCNAQGKLAAPGWSGAIKVGTNGTNTIAGW